MPNNTPTHPPVSQDEARKELRRAALDYHEFPTPGKVAIHATKQLMNQRDLALAYSPGVAAPCEEIAKDPNAAFRYTNRGNLVAVITNGTAVLGLGDIGPLASKPVMEGKAVLFKKFAGIDVFEIEPTKADNPLHKMQNVILSPHNASASARFDPARKRRVGQNIALVLSGRWPLSCVHPTVLSDSKLKRWQPYSMERGPNS